MPDAVLPIAALSPKDRADLDRALEHGVDWIALSFVQRPEDVAEARKIVAGRAGVLSKIEKPAAFDRLDEIIELSDAVMVARGDLGVELPIEEVPRRQKQITRAARAAGKPVVVATQMLEVDDFEPDADARGSVRRRDRGVRRRGCGDAVGGIGVGQVSGRSRRDDGPHRALDRGR